MAEEEEDEFTILSGTREQNKLAEDPKNEIQENAKQFATVSLRINLRADDLEDTTTELNGEYKAEPKQSTLPPQNPLARDEFIIKGYYTENQNFESTSIGMHSLDHNDNEIQLIETKEIAATANIVEDAKIIYTHYENLSLSDTILGDGEKVVMAAILDFDDGVKENDLVFPNAKSFTGVRIDEYLTNIACTPGSAPWNIGAVATWFLDAGVDTPPGMNPNATGTDAKYQRSTAQGWYNWATDTMRFSTTPIIGAAVIVGKTTVKKNKEIVLTPTNVIGIVQNINQDGKIVVLGATSYILPKYTVNPNEDQIRSAITLNEADRKDIDTQILEFATAFISNHEGFISYAMWDCDNWRIGFGSGRIVKKKSDGTPLIIPLNSDYTRQPIGWEDAEKTIIKTQYITNSAINIGQDPSSKNNPMVYPFYPDPQTGEKPFLTTKLFGGPYNGKEVVTTMYKPKDKPEIITITDAMFDLQVRLKEFLNDLKSTDASDKNKFTVEELSYIYKNHPYWLVTLIDIRYGFGQRGIAKYKFIPAAKEAANAKNPQIFYDRLVFNDGKTDVTFGRISRANDQSLLARGLWLTNKSNPFPYIKNKSNYPKEISTPIGPDDVINVSEYMNNFYTKTSLLGMKLTQVTVNPTEIIGYVGAFTKENWRQYLKSSIIDLPAEENPPSGVA